MVLPRCDGPTSLWLRNRGASVRLVHPPLGPVGNITPGSPSGAAGDLHEGSALKFGQWLGLATQRAQIAFAVRGRPDVFDQSCTTRRFFVRRSNSAPHACRSACGRNACDPARAPTALTTFQILCPVIRRSMHWPTLFSYMTTKSGAGGASGMEGKVERTHQSHFFIRSSSPSAHARATP
jgi:hypothetical protein